MKLVRERHRRAARDDVTQCAVFHELGKEMKINAVHFAFHSISVVLNNLVAVDFAVSEDLVVERDEAQKILWATIDTYSLECARLLAVANLLHSAKCTSTQSPVLINNVFFRVELPAHGN